MRNHKHIKATPITAKQYLRDQLTKNTADPLNYILKCYEKLAHKHVTINYDRQGREDTCMNNSNDTQYGNMQEHIVNQILVNHKQEENQRHIPIH